MTGTTYNKKLIRITTVPMALKYLLPGQMKFMKLNGFEVLMISADGKEIVDVIRDEQCPHIIVPMTRRITPFQDLKCILKLIQIFKKEKPDIVHSHTPKAGLLGMLAAKFCKVKIRIHTVAGLPLMVEKGFKYHLLTFIEKLTAKAATNVWPNSNSLHRYIVEHGLADPQKLMVIGSGSSNGIDTDFFNRQNLNDQILSLVKKTIQYSAQNVYLLYAGRLVADKGIVELVNVFKVIQKNKPELKLILVGGYEASLDPVPVNTINEIAGNAGIIHIDWTDNVKYYMYLSGYFVFPSHREGFPNVLLQAGAMELPVICSKIAGNIDIITNEMTGLIFEWGNELQLHTMIERAIDNPEYMHLMAIKLKEMINADYKSEKIWKNILEAYKSLLN